ncbi:MAG: hypothetical protein C4323_15430 [Mastigocladus sp. ERB_26_2]
MGVWNGRCIAGFSPNGQEILQVKLLVQRPTSFTFGSSHLTNLDEFKKLHQQVDLILYAIAVIPKKSTDCNC